MKLEQGLVNLLNVNVIKSITTRGVRGLNTTQVRLLVLKLWGKNHVLYFDPFFFSLLFPSLMDKYM